MTNCCSPDEPLDCAERAACTEAGLPGHSFCGMCAKHDKPRHVCGCMEALLTERLG